MERTRHHRLSSNPVLGNEHRAKTERRKRDRCHRVESGRRKVMWEPVPTRESESVSGVFGARSAVCEVQARYSGRREAEARTADARDTRRAPPRAARRRRLTTMVLGRGRVAAKALRTRCLSAARWHFEQGVLERIRSCGTQTGSPRADYSTQGDYSGVIHDRFDSRLSLWVQSKETMTRPFGPLWVSSADSRHLATRRRLGASRRRFLRRDQGVVTAEC